MNIFALRNVFRRGAHETGVRIPVGTPTAPEAELQVRTKFDEAQRRRMRRRRRAHPEARPSNLRRWRGWLSILSIISCT